MENLTRPNSKSKQQLCQGIELKLPRYYASPIHRNYNN